MLKSLKEIVQFRELLLYLVINELRLRYRGSVFGFLWTLLNPILLMLVMWLVFSRFSLIKEENYGLFLLAGLLGWIFFSQSINHGLNSIVRNRGLIQKIYVPKLVFPMTKVTSNLVNFLFFLIAYHCISIFTTIGISPILPLIIPVFFMVYLLAAGFVFALAALNVFFRDFQHLTDVALRALFYLTPVLYPPRIFGPKLGFLLQFNPLYYPVIIARDVVYYQTVSPPETWAIGFAISFVVFFLGLKLFSSLEDRFVYYV